jgi:chromosome segregation ATPase
MRRSCCERRSGSKITLISTELMAPQANVSSIDAIRQFQAHLATYARSAGSILDEVHGEVQGMRLWLEGEQRAHWQKEVKRLERRLEEAKRLLLNARISTLRDSTGIEQAAVNRARNELQFAQDKLAKTKKWQQVYEGRVASLEKGLSSLRNWLACEMPKAVVFLNQSTENLYAYHRIAGGAPAAVPEETPRSTTGGSI